MSSNRGTVSDEGGFEMEAVAVVVPMRSGGVAPMAVAVEASPSGVVGGAYVVAPVQAGAVVGVAVSSNEFGLSDGECAMLSYRSSVKCFAGIDVFFSLLAFFNSNWLVAFLGCIGPACGYYGAACLQKCNVFIYVWVLAIKTISLIIECFIYKRALSFLLALLQIWITKIVWSFYSTLKSVPEERLRQLRDPSFHDRARDQHAHAIHVRYI